MSSVVDLLGSESALRLWVNPLCKCLESLQDNSSEEFAHDTEQRDATVVVNAASVTLVLVEGDNVGTYMLRLVLKQ